MKVKEPIRVTAQNTFTSWCQLDGVFSLFINGLVNSTVTFQGSPDAGSTIYDLETFSDASLDNRMHIGKVPITDWLYRAGVKTGHYGSDTVIVRLEAE